MADIISKCFPCFRKENGKWNTPEYSRITGYDVLYIEVPEKDKSAFEDKRPTGRELTLTEYMALYAFVTENQLPRPLYDCEYECFYFLNGDRFIILQGWLPKKRAPWMRPPLASIPKEKISFIGKFREPKKFGPAKRYEVKEYKGNTDVDQEETRLPSNRDNMLNTFRKQTRPRNANFSQLFP